jgi:hypothetical protein
MEHVAVLILEQLSQPIFGNLTTMSSLHSCLGSTNPAGCTG